MTKFNRKISATDRVVGLLDDALRTVFGHPSRKRSTPQPQDLNIEDTLDPEYSARLMRVNHSGEVCAQALYQAQAITARSDDVRKAMELAAQEENDHLSWCEQRLEQLGSHKSFLNPLWYCGSFGIGIGFGLLGDRWNLGFLAETERQVVEHLGNHLEKLPRDDERSRAILRQMQTDEANHATHAIEAGAQELPAPMKSFMRAASKVMTTAAARI